MTNENIFEQWDANTDLKGLKDDIASSRTGKKEFVDVPYGTYEVKISRMELKPSSKNDPMVQAIFEVTSGDYKGKTILMNQVVTQGFQLDIMNNILRSLDSGVEIKFDSYSQYKNLIMDVMEQIDTQGLEYALIYGKNNKGFNTFTIDQVFEA